MRSLHAALLLALAPAALATTLAATPAAAQTQQWSGSSLAFTTPASCRLAVDRAYLAGSGWSATVRVVLRNRGTAPMRVSGRAELAGDGQRKSGNFGPNAVPANGTAEIELMNPYGGSLANSRLTVTVAACPAG